MFIIIIIIIIEYYNAPQSSGDCAVNSFSLRYHICNLTTALHFVQGDNAFIGLHAVLSQIVVRPNMLFSEKKTKFC